MARFYNEDGLVLTLNSTTVSTGNFVTTGLSIASQAQGSNANSRAGILGKQIVSDGIPTSGDRQKGIEDLQYELGQRLTPPFV